MSVVVARLLIEVLEVRSVFVSCFRVVRCTSMVFLRVWPLQSSLEGGKGRGSSSAPRVVV